jgi:hypothetical protein
MAAYRFGITLRGDGTTGFSQSVVYVPRFDQTLGVSSGAVTFQIHYGGWRAHESCTGSACGTAHDVYQEGANMGSQSHGKPQKRWQIVTIEIDFTQ